MTSGYYKFTSSDGITWNRSWDYTTGNRYYNDITFGNGLFFISAGYYYCISSDGKNWTVISMNSTKSIYINSAAYGP